MNRSVPLVLVDLPYAANKRLGVRRMALAWVALRDEQAHWQKVRREADMPIPTVNPNGLSMWRWMLRECSDLTPWERIAAGGSITAGVR